MRETIVAGNWKMNLNSLSIMDFIKDFPHLVEDITEVKNIIFPSSVYLYLFKEQNTILYGGQNVHFEEKGAFTAEISPGMLRDMGCKYVIIGHSERRHIFGENNDLLNKKLISVLNNNLNPIYCIGETLEERKSNKAFEVLKKQLVEGLKDIENIEKLIIAYEPVWAIGTGETATPEIAQEAHKFIRTTLNEMQSNRGENITVLYGGSVKPQNAKSLIKMQDIDGFLVGGASLVPETFAQITRIIRED
ncbi:triose-phosphate isomerase [bacterium]|nr:triose-phosphate isomerase [bacterium]